MPSRHGERVDVAGTLSLFFLKSRRFEILNDMFRKRKNYFFGCEGEVLLLIILWKSKMQGSFSTPKQKPETVLQPQ